MKHFYDVTCNYKKSVWFDGYLVGTYRYPIGFILRVVLSGKHFTMTNLQQDMFSINNYYGMLLPKVFIAKFLLSVRSNVSCK